MLLAVLMCILPTAMAQKSRITEFTQAGLPAEMQEYLEQATSDKDKKAEVGRLMRDFGTRYGSLQGSLQGRVVGICNTVLKLKVRQHPDVMNFISVFNQMTASSAANFDQWLSCIEFLQARNKKVKDFTDFIEFTGALVSSRTLYAWSSTTVRTATTAPSMAPRACTTTLTTSGLATVAA